ncbi:MAG: DUF1653 domain-containing protein [Lachnospiraceae bacterium]|nr:DUF1653 domain-containing protein [Lachnospiraceae bacterium]
MYRDVPKQGEFYKHFKGKMYQIVAIAIHSETGEELVIYQKLYDDFKVHARPLSMFMSEVDREKYPDVTQKYRFEKVTPLADALEKEMSVVKEIPHEKEVSIAEDTIVENNEVDEENPNADLLEFLNAETYEQKRNVLVGLRHRITDRLIDDMAASMDVVVEETDTWARYESLLACITTKAKFEITRN